MKQQKTQQRRQKAQQAERRLRPHRIAKSAARPLAAGTLRVVPLGGQNGIGEKNMIVLEYENDAIVLDCGFSLGLNLPGVNYAIPVTDYLASIKHKLRGYVISHGHMDHIGALIHTVPANPAPIYGSRFTIGMVNAQFEKAQENGMTYQQQTIEMNMDSHEQIKLGVFTIELVRMTHSIPESSLISVDTPVGKVINTGDFRLDPEPLDDMPSDIRRLKQLGKENVVLLMSESTNANRFGRTPTEHTLVSSFDDIIRSAKGRVFAALFSTNMNRIQMVIDAAAKNDRKVALDGRSMMATAELAVRLGNLKIPKGTLIAMRETVSVPDNKLVVICTGGQGEPGAAMSRMSAGEHQYIKLKRGDSVIISSTPIPGNEISYQQVGDDLAKLGVLQYRHPTHELDGCGPLHVSGHGNQDEHAEMIRLTKPQHFMPIYGGPLNREYHRRVALEQGIKNDRIIMVDNGGVIEFAKGKLLKQSGTVTSGSQLIDQNGEIVPNMVLADRFELETSGFMVVSVTIDRATGRLLSSPDIITRGAFMIKDNKALMDALRARIRAVVRSHKVTKQTIELVKYNLQNTVRDHMQGSNNSAPLIIPVVTVAGAVRVPTVPAKI